MRKIQKPIRVLHIVGIMNMGGIENLLMNIYRNIDREEIQFDFLVTREEKGIFDDEIKSLGGNIYNIPHMSSVGVLKYKKILFEFFKEHKEFRIVHCHRDALCSIYLKQAKKAKVQVRIAHSHTIQLAEGKGIKGIFKTLIKVYFRAQIKYTATHYFACSEEAGRWLFGKKIEEEQLVVVKNGIESSKYVFDEDMRKQIREELGLSENTILIGHIGRMETPKNHEFLLDVFSQICKTGINVKLCLVGTGILEKELREKSKILGIADKIIWLGIRRDVNKLMMGFDVFLFPSLFEGLGIVLVEAQAAGLTCVVSDNVPREVDQGLGLISFKSLQDKKIWESYVIDVIKKNETRTKVYQENILKNGYDIDKTINDLKEFYLGCNWENN